MRIPKYVLPHRATIIPFLGSGAYGPIWEEDPAKYKKNVPFRIEPKRKQVTVTNGQEKKQIVQTAESIFQPDILLKVGDKIRWDLTGSEYTVEEIVPIDALGPHSLEVVLA